LRLHTSSDAWMRYVASTAGQGAGGPGVEIRAAFQDREVRTQGHHAPLVAVNPHGGTSHIKGITPQRDCRQHPTVVNLSCCRCAVT